jgi:hypothetical protein
LQALIEKKYKIIIVFEKRFLGESLLELHIPLKEVLGNGMRRYGF